MGIKGAVFVGLFGVCSLLALIEPFYGIAAYVVYYHSSPENAWWGASLSAAGVRYSVIITSCLAIGTLLNLGKLPYGPMVIRHERLYLLFLAWLLILGILAPMQAATFKGVALSVTDPFDKMLKVTPFLFALSHVVVTLRRFDQFIWLIVACGLYLGYECRTTPASHYVNGRLEGVGPSDARDSNMLAAHLVALLPFIGVKFLQSGWKGKVVCFMAGGLVANGVVLTRSRGAYLAIITGGIVGLVMIPKGQRKRILPLVVLGALGTLTIVDSGFTQRMSSLEAGEREKDESAQSRLRFWKAGLQMWLDHPLGVGPGNFNARVGEYLPEDAGRDPHNTYVRCLADLGIPGITLFLGMIGNAFITLQRLRHFVEDRPEFNAFALDVFALQIALPMYLIACIFISCIYIEMLWWILFLPSALERVAANLQLDFEISSVVAS